MGATGNDALRGITQSIERLRQFRAKRGEYEVIDEEVGLDTDDLDLITGILTGLLAFAKPTPTNTRQ
ncbi:hypothetical protein [Sphingomonas sp. GM_Shp_2]|uniref:hypothetical protein n=1 Tax=Sphingomonas sp. GM_Shp_2 TaxID=2937380 RepID=UPI00226A25C0|nr:hypothetical protein [Sphingomonas sp. GM_Shp_2]